MNSSVRKLFRNIIANQAGFLVSVVVTFFLSPFVVNSLGSTRYGIWSLIVSLTGNYGLLAFGIQGAMTRYIAHAAATNDRERVKGYFNTALSFFLCSAGLTIIIGLCISQFIDRIFILPSSLLLDARSACVLVTFSAAATFAFAAFDSFLVAHQQFQLTNAVGTITTLIRAGMTVWILKHGYGIVALAALGTGLTLFNGLLEMMVAKRMYSWLKVSLLSAKLCYIKELMSYAYKSFVFGIAVSLVYQCDLLVIGTCLPPEKVTVYSLASTLITYLIQFVSTIAFTFNPYATELYASNKVDEMRSFFIKGSCLMYMLGGWLVAGCLLFGKDFFTLWVGPQFADSATILSILVIPQFFATGSRIAGALLIGMARIGPLAVAAICEGVCNLILSLILVRYFGLIGVAIGTLIPCVVNNGFWLPIYLVRKIGIKQKMFLQKSILPGIIQVLSGYGIGFTINIVLNSVTWFVFFTKISIFLICSLLIAICIYRLFYGYVILKKTIYQMVGFD